MSKQVLTKVASRRIAVSDLMKLGGKRGKENSTGGRNDDHSRCERGKESEKDRKRVQKREREQKRERGPFHKGENGS